MTQLMKKAPLDRHRVPPCPSSDKVFSQGLVLNDSGDANGLRFTIQQRSNPSFSSVPIPIPMFGKVRSLL